MVQAIAKNLAS